VQGPWVWSCRASQGRTWKDQSSHDPAGWIYAGHRPSLWGQPWSSPVGTAGAVNRAWKGRYWNISGSKRPRVAWNQQWNQQTWTSWDPNSWTSKDRNWNIWAELARVENNPAWLGWPSSNQTLLGRQDLDNPDRKSQA
jgi:hypothetical protein